MTVGQRVNLAFTKPDPELHKVRQEAIRVIAEAQQLTKIMTDEAARLARKIVREAGQQH